jgi:glycine/D-amino acid oxidase-like deaminating enzyme/nitrite reductase/ring-hydroxylating ferredoxin subunit
VTGRGWDLVVVGAGIVGLLSALRARESGRDVCVVDAGRIGEGTTAHATVKVTSGHGTVLAQVGARHGTGAALSYQRANDAAFHRLRTIAACLPEDVGWTTAPHIVHASAVGSLELLRTTEALALQAGSRLTRCEPPPWGAGGSAWAWADSALVQPLSLARALGRMLQAAGVPVVEHARVVQVRDGSTHPRVRIQGGAEIRAEDVLIASHVPVHDPDAHALRVEIVRHAAIAVSTEIDVPASYDVDGMSTRPLALPDGRPGAVVVGTGHHAGSMTQEAWSQIRGWAAVALEAGSVTHEWGAQDMRAFDRLPYVGRTRRSPHILVATGMNGWGFTNAAAVADLLPALLDSGAHSPTTATRALKWTGNRIYPSGGLHNAAASTWWVGRSLVGDHVASMMRVGGPLLPGQGRVVGGPVTPRAECLTRDGEQHCVSARCTHLGCLVRWNDAEQSWDCPCHGSRFGPDGTVLEGPAKRDLNPI